MHPVELNFKFGPYFGPAEWQQAIRMIVDQMGFAEDSRYELILDQESKERLVMEVGLNQLDGMVHPRNWGGIHQLVFSHPWMKTMNVKIQTVRRSDAVALTVRAELGDLQARDHFTAKIQEWVNGQTQAHAQLDSLTQDRERLFGSMVLHEKVVQRARDAFLHEDFQGSLRAGVALLDERLGQLLHIHLKDRDRLLHVFNQDPPCILLPELSGVSLRQELQGLSYLLAGCTALLESHLQDRAPSLNTPGSVLKYLVIFSLLLERLEGASPNPAVKPLRRAAEKGKTRLPKKPAQRSRAVAHPKVKAKAKAAVKKKRARKKTAVRSTRRG